jgi:hypothetical protein
MLITNAKALLKEGEERFPREVALLAEAKVMTQNIDPFDPVDPEQEMQPRLIRREDRAFVLLRHGMSQFEAAVKTEKVWIG